MQKTLTKIAALAFAAGLTVLSGCHSTVSPIAKNAPEWVNKGSGAFKDAGQSVFYGVGSDNLAKIRQMRQTNADTRACAEIAKTLNRYVAALNKDYMSSASAGTPGQSSDEQMTSQTLKTYAQFTLNGASVIDHWVDTTDGSIFSLCKLDMKSVADSLSNAKELNSKVKDYIKADAEKAFDDLSSEEAKHN